MNFLCPPGSPVATAGRFLKILIIKPSSLGDIIHSLPLLNRLKKSFDGSSIHWVIDRSFSEILEGHPMIDRLWVINKDEWKDINKLGVTVNNLKKLFKNLKAEMYDLVIDLQGLLRSGIIAKATGSMCRIGFSEAREGATMFYTHTVKGGRNVHAVDRYLKVADFLGLKSDDIQFPFPPLPDLQTVGISDLIKNDYVVIAPGARWQTKMWPTERFGKVASMLSLNTVVIGSPSESPLAEEVVRSSKGKALSIAGKTGLKELAAVIRGAKFMLCNDSGPMHIAAAMGVPVFAIFGPTDPLRTGPYGDGHAIIRNNVSCSPCRKRRCKDGRCMIDLKVETVYEIIKKKGR